MICMTCFTIITPAGACVCGAIGFGDLSPAEDRTYSVQASIQDPQPLRLPITTPAKDRWTRRFVWHLEAIPGLLQLMRESVVPLKSSRTDGDVISGGGDPRRLPFNADAVDEADLLWALLVIYAREVAFELGGSSPSILRSEVWSTSEAQGLPPGLSEAGAYALGDEVVRWLIPRALEVALIAGLQDTEDHLFAHVRAARTRYGLDERPTTRKRLCDVCGGRGVVAGYSDVGGREVSRVWCLLCGHEEEVMTIDGTHVPAGGEQSRPVGEDDQTLEAPRSADGA